MQKFFPLFIFLLAGACLNAQTPSPAPAAEPAQKTQPSPSATDPAVFTSDAGYTFSYPADWELVDIKPMMPVQRMKAEERAKSDMERKGAECVQVQLTIRHGDPKSVILTMFLEYSCVGGVLGPNDLGTVGLGIANGMTKNFEMKDPKYAAYKLGGHDFWIERAQGNPAGKPEIPYSIEITCSMLKKGLVCWLALARTPDAITSFETGKVSLEGDAPVALVPPTAFK